MKKKKLSANDLGGKLDKKDLLLALFYSSLVNGTFLTRNKIHGIIAILSFESPFRIFKIKKSEFGPRSPEVEELLKELNTEGIIEIEKSNGVEVFVLTERGIETAREAYEKMFAVWGGGLTLAIIDAWTKAPEETLIFYLRFKYPFLFKKRKR